MSNRILLKWAAYTCAIITLLFAAIGLHHLLIALDSFSGLIVLRTYVRFFYILALLFTLLYAMASRQKDAFVLLIIGLTACFVFELFLPKAGKYVSFYRKDQIGQTLTSVMAEVEQFKEENKRYPSDMDEFTRWRGEELPDLFPGLLWEYEQLGPDDYRLAITGFFDQTQDNKQLE